MRAAENNGVNAACLDVAQIMLNAEFCDFIIGRNEALLHNGNKKRTIALNNGDIRVDFFYFFLIGAAADSCPGADNANFAVFSGLNSGVGSRRNNIDIGNGEYICEIKNGGTNRTAGCNHHFNVVT